MSDQESQKKIEAAIELGFLNEKQLETLERERRESNYPALEIAIRKGFLNRKHLDVLNILAAPESFVPGYRIEGVIGEGGVGTVYKAMQIRMDRAVAIKTILRSAARNELTPKRFEREARIVGQLRHPNIISAFDFGVHNEKLYLVMEFIDGVDAEKQLLKQPRFPESHAWFIARQVCHALDNAKALGIIHRDIKPGNLILTHAPAGTPLPAGVPFVKVADFGLAKFNDPQRDAAITLDQSISGTPFYMSPEQIKGLDIDHRSDIYSLGATIWNMISGSPPIVGNSPLDVITNKMKLEDAWLEPTGEMSEAGFQLLKKMCRHDREQRIDDYFQLSREIDLVIQSLEHATTRSSDSELANSSDFSGVTKVTTMQELAKTIVLERNGDVSTTQDFVPALRDSFGSRSSSSFTTTDFAPANDAQEQSVLSRNLGDRSLPALSKRVTGIRWPLLFGGILLLGLSVPAAGYFFASTETGAVAAKGEDDAAGFEEGGSTAVPRVRLANFAGPSIPLFNGKEVDPTQKFSGTWQPTTGGEGAPVLSGRGGFRNFRCRDNFRKPLSLYRFVCGFRHNEADLIEFKLFTETDDGDTREFFSVRIESDKAVLQSGDLTGQCELQQFDDEENFGYPQFRIESQPGYWRIEVDRELLGEIEKPANFIGAGATIQLSVQGQGAAHFEGISLRKFVAEEAVK